jgi:hypothetical protein
MANQTIDRQSLDRRNFLRSFLFAAAAVSVAIPASLADAAPALVDPDLPARDAAEAQARDLRPADRPGDGLAPDSAAPAGSRRGRRVKRRTMRRTRRHDRRMERRDKRMERRERRVRRRD